MKTSSAPLRRVAQRWLLPWMAGVVGATLLAWAVQRSGVLFAVDAKLYDIGVISRPTRVPEEITVVGLSDSFVAGHHVSQMPRDKIARLVDVLAAAKPRAIALDVWLDSRVEDGARRGDETLRAALLRAKKSGVPVFLAQKTVESGDAAFRADGSGQGTTAHGATLPFFADAASGVGGVDFVPDADHVVRAMPLETRALPSLAYQAVSRAASNRDEVIRMAALHEALLDQTRMIDFCAPPGPGESRIQVHDAQNLLDHPELSLLLAPNKVIFIGATFPRSDDLFKSPFNTTAGPRRFYGVELLANAAFTYLHSAARLSHEHPFVQGRTLRLAVGLAMFVAVAALCGLLPGVLALLISIGATLYFAVASARGAAAAWPVYLAPSPLLASALGAWALCAGWRQRIIARELKLVQDTFGDYVGAEVLKQLGGRLPEMGGEMRDIAVLFCDIQGFSALAEGLRDDPARLLQLLNEHFAPLVEALKKRGAYVDNYVGDLVMAVFGAPLSAGDLKSDTRAAVLAARDFESIIETRNANLKDGAPQIEVGIGVHCGPAVVGNLGSRERMKYTAIGDTVNIASRVESETRHHPTRLLVTEEVTAQCPEFRWEFVTETTVKGRRAPVRLYRPLREEAA